MSPALAISKIRADLARHRVLFDLRFGGLGADLCKAATDGVQNTIAAEQDPDGNPWPPLSGGYEAWKSFKYPGNPMGVLHGILANPREVAGDVSVSETSAEVTYGVSAQARQEAGLFSEDRPFWGFTAQSLDEVRTILDRRFSAV